MLNCLGWPSVSSLSAQSTSAYACAMSTSDTFNGALPSLARSSLHSLMYFRLALMFSRLVASPSLPSSMDDRYFVVAGSVSTLTASSEPHDSKKPSEPLAICNWASAAACFFAAASLTAAS